MLSLKHLRGSKWAVKNTILGLRRAVWLEIEALGWKRAAAASRDQGGTWGGRGSGLAGEVGAAEETREVIGASHARRSQATRWFSIWAGARTSSHRKQMGSTDCGWAVSRVLG